VPVQFLESWILLSLSAQELAVISNRTQADTHWGAELRIRASASVNFPLCWLCTDKEEGKLTKCTKEDMKSALLSV
jgi:hypothetical protein